jgi:valyl-tRNA synthetase
MSLKQVMHSVVHHGDITIIPERFNKTYFHWIDNLRDWCISRQIWWGHRIPVWYNGERLVVSAESPGTGFAQDPDTLDTWFSAALWTWSTLIDPKLAADKSLSLEDLLKKSPDFQAFHPTSVMETGYDILRAWVARMIMMGYYRTKKVPFETVFLHGMVRDKHGVKMSKSKGNVINPLEMVEKYGADALRGALVFGTKEGGDVVLSEDKIIGMRNFANKMWNIGRFITMNELHDEKKTLSKESQMTMKSLQKEFTQTKKKYHAYVSKYQLAKSFDLMYDFIWHRFADFYIEQLKEELKNGNIETSKLFTEVYTECLKMVHPYMPFVTDAIWKQFKGEESSILESSF